MFKKALTTKDLAQDRPGIGQLSPSQAFGWVAGFHNPTQMNGAGPNDPLSLMSFEGCWTSYPNDPNGQAACIKDVVRQNLEAYDMQYSQLDEAGKEQLIGYIREALTSQGINNIDPASLLPTT